MNDPALKRDVAVSMRLRGDDLGIIDHGALLSGLSRTEFMRRAALNEAQVAILNETLVRLDPDAFSNFMDALAAPTAPIPPKLRERLSRPAPWDESAIPSSRP